MEKFERQLVNASKLPPHVLEKWSPSVLSEGFVPFPKKLVRSMRQIFNSPDSIKELAVVLAVVDFKRPNLTRKPSLAYLAFLAGFEESEFEAVLHQLELKGYIQTSGTHDGMEISLVGLMQTIEKETEL
jgi:hypothetical protein